MFPPNISKTQRIILSPDCKTSKPFGALFFTIYPDLPDLQTDLRFFRVTIHIKNNQLTNQITVTRFREKADFSRIVSQHIQSQDDQCLNRGNSHDHGLSPDLDSLIELNPLLKNNHYQINLQ